MQSLSPGDQEKKHPNPAIDDTPLRKPSAEITPAQSPVGSVTETLEERLAMYKDAIKVATSQNDTSKVRRYGRAVKVCDMFFFIPQEMFGLLSVSFGRWF